jgi:hypothetical protein
LDSIPQIMREGRNAAFAWQVIADKRDLSEISHGTPLSARAVPDGEAALESAFSAERLNYPGVSVALRHGPQSWRDRMLLFVAWNALNNAEHPCFSSQKLYL